MSINHTAHTKETTPIAVLKIEPGEYPSPAYLMPTIEAFKYAVSIGADEIGEVRSKRVGKDVYVLFNQDRCLAGLEGNRRIGKDILAGVIYVVGVTPKYHPRSLRDEEMAKYMSRYWEPETFSDIEIVEVNLDVLYQSLDDLEKL